MVFTPLKTEDFLGVIATSSPAKQERFETGTHVLEGLGLNLKIAGDPYGAYGTDRYLFSSASATERAANLMKLFVDPSVKAVMAARGAYGAIELLPLLDAAIFRNNPKPFIGFSDSTALLVALQSWGCPVVHGPHVESFTWAAKEPEVLASAQTISDLLLRALPPEPMAIEPFGPLTSNISREVLGELTGGNLSVLAALSGTPWQLNARNRILFLEETNEKPYRVHRMLLQLQQSGALEGVLGVCLGAFTKCEVGEKAADGITVGASLEAVMLNILTSLQVPLYRGIPSGHIKRNVALPFFGRAKISNNQLSFELRAS